MIVKKKYFPEIIPDNDEMYFSSLIGYIESIDELCSVQITHDKSKYHFRVAPSHPKYTQLLFDELINFHNLFSIRLDISKSIKTTGTIAFNIKLTT